MLAPLVLNFVYYYVTAYSLFSAVTDADPEEKESLYDASISVLINYQFEFILLTLPGLVVCSFMVLFEKVSFNWMQHSLKIISIFTIFTVPFLTLVGLYTYFLSTRVKSNA